MYCKGFCSNYLAKYPDLKIVGLYELGYKRCSNCEVYIIWDGRSCPCCGRPLRRKPRGAKGRDKLAQKLIIKNPFPKNNFKS